MDTLETVTLPGSSSREGRSGPVPSAERRERRRDVEMGLLRGVGTMALAELLSTKWGVSARTIRTDVSVIERRWRSEDSRRMAQRRGAVIRRLERAASLAEQVADVPAAVSANVALAKCLGMITNGGNAPTVDARSVHLHLDATKPTTEDLSKALALLGAASTSPAPSAVRSGAVLPTV